MATEVTISVPEDEHLAYIAENMRRSDREEVWATGEFSPMGAIVDSLKVSSSASVALFDDVPGVVFGIADAAVSMEALVGLLGKGWADRLKDARLGVIWALTATTVDSHPVSFYKASQASLAGLTAGYDYVLNFVDERNERSLRWLEALGFETLPAVPFGAQQMRFCPVILEVSDV